jgi:myo-inositol-1(or 4)-monophosphatase
MNNKLLAVAVEAVLKAGEILKKGFGTRYEITSKPGIQNLVTEYDKAAEKSVMETIRSYFPDHNFLAEESGKTDVSASSIIWVIDPLDGTVNFAHNIPFFSVSVAACTAQEVLCGAVFNPLTQELFSAEKGKGATLNGKPIKVSAVSKIKDAFLATGFPYDVHENLRFSLGPLTRILEIGSPVRRLGSACLDLSYVACGRFDAFWEAVLQPWDVAAGKLILEEAGGKITHYNGKPHPIFSSESVIATNGVLHEQMLSIFK